MNSAHGWQRHSLQCEPFLHAPLRRRDRAWLTAILCVIALLHAASFAHADVEYVYDDAGRLTQVVGADGSVVLYEYDPAGNLLSISQAAGSLISITSFTPTAGAPGSSVTITGGAFSPTPNENIVRFNGVAATVASASVSTLTVTVPSGASTGPITVEAPAGTAQSAAPFTVLGGLGPLPVTLTSGQTLTVPFTASGPSGYSLALTPFVSSPSGGSVNATILRPNGSSLKNCGTYSATAGQCDFSVSDAGTYQVRLTPSGSASMTFNVIVSEDLFGTITPGAPPITFNATVPGQNIRYTFPGVAGERATLFFRNNTIDYGTVYVRKPDGSALTNTGNYHGYSSWGVDMTFPTTGTHTAMVYVDRASTGSVDIQLIADAQETILTDGTRTLVDLANGQNGIYWFTANGASSYSLAITDFSSAPGGASVNATILNPNGSALKNCGSYSATSGHCDFTITTAGTYRVRIDPTGTAAVNFNLIVSEDLHGELVAGDPAVRFDAVVPGQDKRYAFEGEAGQSVSLVFTNNTIGSGTIYVARPDGSVLTNTGNYGGSTAWTKDFTLPVTGTYQAIVFVDGASTGSVEVRLLTDAVGMVSTDGTPLSAELEAGQNARYTFNASAPSQGFSLAMTGFASTPAGDAIAATILNPDGSVNKNCGDYSASQGHCDFWSTTAGTYTVRLNPKGMAATSFNLIVAEDATGTLTFGAPPVRFEATVPGQNKLYSFEGTAGQPIRLLFTNNTIGYGTIYLRKPDGTTLTNTGNYHNKTSWTLNATLPTDGTYVAVVYVDGNSTGVVDVQLVSP